MGASNLKIKPEEHHFWAVSIDRMFQNEQEERTKTHCLVMRIGNENLKESNDNSHGYENLRKM
ncbi:CLUMA_CG011098, isoform A [Clunio marinus]|uniref:CLUMA_CG011098, isoform A n=1 Tax=Clunio marinus TaxID=568069 RepID=A0A1J1IFE3_9DIPT|nr:CLUMA_CG011098, isoform A [Clunio marinus]